MISPLLLRTTLVNKRLRAILLLQLPSSSLRSATLRLIQQAGTLFFYSKITDTSLQCSRMRTQCLLTIYNICNFIFVISLLF